MKKKKGQITLFILVGILLLIVFGSLFAFINFAKKENFDDASRDQALGQPLITAQVEDIIYRCIQQAAEDSMFVLGIQSGHIFESQNGPDESTNGILYEHTKQLYIVPFGIIRGDDEVPPPQYPKEYGEDGYKYTLERLQFDYSRSHLWGRRILPKLCELKGPNSPATRSCDSSTYGSENQTIQYKLQKAVQTQTHACLQRESEKIDLLIGDFTYNASNMSVLITDSDVKFTLGLSATTQKDGRSTHIEDVSFSLPVRLKRVYNLLFYMIESDITNVFFNKQTDYAQITRCNYAQSIQCWDEQMRVSIIRSPQPDAHPGADIILIEDRGSLLKGQPFFFATSIENRPPVLDYLFESTTEVGVEYERTNDSSIFFNPVAYDPDEDTLTMEYKGWKQNGFETSSDYMTGSNCDGKPQWCASFVFHNLRSDIEIVQPTVSDENGLTDYQPTYIRVGDESVDDGVFCPEVPSDFTSRPCNPLQDTCVCQGNTHCIWSEPKPIICQEGSICCQILSAGTGTETTNLMTCHGAECYQSSKNANIAQDCRAGSECHQFTTNANAIQSCTDANCWQETRKGKVTQTCSGIFCSQETDQGLIESDCRPPRSELSTTQSQTLQICE